MLTSNSNVCLATSGQQIKFNKISKQFWKTRCLDVTKTKKAAAAHVTHLKLSLILLLKIFLRQAECCS